MAKGWSFDGLVKALGNGAFLNIGTTANTLAAGDDNRIINALQGYLSGTDIQNPALFFSNIGGRSAGLRDVGAGANQIPDINYFNTGNGSSFRMPDGHIVQFDSGSGNSSGGFTKAYPTPFPNLCQVLIPVVYGTLGSRTFATANASDRTAANINCVDVNGNGVVAFLGYIAIGR